MYNTLSARGFIKMNKRNWNTERRQRPHTRRRCLRTSNDVQDRNKHTRQLSSVPALCHHVLAKRKLFWREYEGEEQQELFLHRDAHRARLQSRSGPRAVTSSRTCKQARDEGRKVMAQSDAAWRQRGWRYDWLMGAAPGSPAARGALEVCSGCGNVAGYEVLPFMPRTKE